MAGSDREGVGLAGGKVEREVGYGHGQTNGALPMTPVAIHRSVALGMFRSSVFFFFAVAAFSENNSQTRTLLLTIVFLFDVVSWHLCQVVNINGHLVYNQTWFNTLADRFIFEKLLDRFRERQHIEQEITQEGTKAAASDVEVYLKGHTVWAEWGWIKKTLAGIGVTRCRPLSVACPHQIIEPVARRPALNVRP